MNKFIFWFLFLLVFLKADLFGQVIPVGSSVDSVGIKTPANTFILEGKYGVHYYKPATYNPLTSPILFFIHGIGGDGAVAIDIKDLADRQKALIVAPTMHNGQLGWAYVAETFSNTVTSCYETYWYTQITKDIYRHVLSRENRSSIDTYLTGFSAGGQFVTRYMLIRQFSPDSIPIKMAVSVNPSNYTLMTDTFNSAPMPWNNYRCGLAGGQPFQWGSSCTQTVTTAVKDFICNEHILQYYNENYGVLIGTGDTNPSPGFCSIAQGFNRFDRAKKFYAFSTTDAIARGTTLKWQYDSVAGVGHDQILMYNTKRNLTDTFTIAEELMFKTPQHAVQQFTPVCMSAIGVNEYSVFNKIISIYPNPNNGKFTIDSKEEGLIIVTDILGREILSRKIEIGKNEILLHGENSGVYLIRVKTEHHQSFQKLIVQK